MLDYLFRVSGALQTKRMKIEEVFDLVRHDNEIEIYKVIDGSEILISNQLILRTKFICHRINTLHALACIPPEFGVEFDVRDYGNQLILSHDPFNTDSNSDSFEDYVKHIGSRFALVNVKSERIELKILDLLRGCNVGNFAFLDSSLPMICLLRGNVAARFSEYEPLEYCTAIKDFTSWIWIDCITKFPLTVETYQKLRALGKPLCLVSPDLHNRPAEITIYRSKVIENGFWCDAICCKLDNIIHWI